MRSSQKAFTLIELLVVIAIISILSSVVLANLNGARQKARDTKRIADIKQLQLALALYFDANTKYPGQLADLSPTYISPIPASPSGAAYTYVPLNSTCNSYHLGAVLEQASNSVLTNDVDALAASSVGSNCGNSAVTASADFYGTGKDCSYGNAAGVAQGQSGATELCFDVTP